MTRILLLTLSAGFSLAVTAAQAADTERTLNFEIRQNNIAVSKFTSTIAPGKPIAFRQSGVVSVATGVVPNRKKIVSTPIETSFTGMLRLTEDSASSPKIIMTCNRHNIESLTDVQTKAGKLQVAQMDNSATTRVENASAGKTVEERFGEYTVRYTLLN